MTAHEQGYRDFRNGMFLSDCPFESGTRACGEWVAGWLEAETHMLAGLA